MAYSDLSTNDQERLDPDNGLLLSANLDALFDRYLITFGEPGELILGASITHQHLALLGPVSGLQSQPTSKRRAYLRRHNEEFERREKALGVAPPAVDIRPRGRTKNNWFYLVGRGATVPKPWRWGNCWRRMLSKPIFGRPFQSGASGDDAGSKQADTDATA